MFELNGIVCVILGLCLNLVFSAVIKVDNSDDVPVTYRLSNESIPENYFIHLETNIHTRTDFIYSGYVTIDIKIVRDTSVLRLHQRQINVETIELRDSKQNIIPIIRFSSIVDYDFLDIELENELKASDEKYKLKITFTAPLREIAQGFYRSHYFDKDGVKRWLATTQFEPTNARYAFPCYDEPGLKSTFELEIRHHSSYSAVSNFNGVRVNEVDSEYVITKFDKTVNMSSYLLAFIVSDYVSNENLLVTPKQSVYTRSNAIEHTNLALEEGIKIIKALEDYVGVKYSLEKLDQASIPDFQPGAMENWGLVTYKEDLLLFNEKTGPIKQKLDIITTIAHEFGHQFFGNLVSPKWWEFIWLNEGFATLMEHYVPHLLYPTERYMDLFVINRLQYAMTADGLETTRPMNHYAESPAGISGLFDTVAYHKSGSVLRMVQQFLTEETFGKGLKLYLEKYEFDVAVPDNLFSALAEAVEADLGASPEYELIEFLNSWTQQKGYPLLTVTRNQDDETILLTQQPFRYKKSGESSEETWIIPLNFYTSNAPIENVLNTIWMPRQADFELQVSLDESDWIIFNMEHAGFYRVNYDISNWELITNYLTTEADSFDKIGPLSRAQLIDDSFNLARAGILPYEIPLRLALYLENEVDYIPWAAANANFKYLHSFLLTADVNEVWTKYINKLIDSTIDKIGYTPKDQDTKFEILLRSVIIDWSCKLGNTNCLEFVKNARSTYFDSGAIDPNLKEQILCYGLDEDEWLDLMLQILDISEAAQNPADHVTFLNVVGCVNSTELLKIVLDISVEEEVQLRGADRNRLFTSVLSNTEYGLNLTVDFVRASYSAIQTLYSGNRILNNLVVSMASYVRTEREAEKFETDLLNPLQNVIDEATIVSAKNIMSDQLLWQTEFKGDISKFLRKNNVLDSRTYRLLNESIAENYFIHLETDIHTGTDFTYSGYVTIDIKIIHDTDVLRLHQRQINVDTVELRDGEQNIIPIIRFSSRVDYDFLDIELENELKASDEKYKLKITFTAPLREIAQGFYRSHYIDDDETEHWLATTQFESTNARYAFPCYDEPGLKSTFELEIRHHSSYSAVSNFNGVRVNEADSEYVITKFDKTVKMSTYLLAFIVSDYVSNDNLLATPKQSVYTRSNAIEHTKLALEEGVKIIKALEDYVGVKYSLEKLDQASIPDFQPGAMENWGLVTYKEDLLLFNEKTGSIKQKLDIITTIAHEYGHQFFGNLVSPKWWEFIWLNEGFATLMEHYLPHLLYPTERYMDLFVINRLQYAMTADGLETTRPMNHYAESPAGISGLFDTIAYHKSGSVLRMVQQFLTEETFGKGLKLYLEKYEFDVAVPDNLFSALAEVVEAELGTSPEYDLIKFLNSWTQQKGYPVLTVSRNQDDKTISLTQQPFRYKKSGESSDQTWIIPISFYTSNAPIENGLNTIWMPQQTELMLEVSLDTSDWIIFNVEQTGFYRVNYDTSNWELIAKYLFTDDDAFNTVAPITRAQLIDDSFNLARAGILPYEIPLNLVLYLANETDYIPWAAANANFKYLHSFLLTADVNEVWTKYINELINNTIDRIGYTPKEDDTNFEILLRSVIVDWSCKLGNTECLDFVGNARSTYFDSGAIDPNLKEQIFCYGLGVTDFSRLLTQILNTTAAANNPADHVKLLNAIGCAERKAFLQIILDTSVTEEVPVRSADRNRLFTSVLSRTELGLDVTIDFVSANYSDIQRMYSGNKILNNLVVSMASYVRSASEAAKFETDLLNALQNVIDETTIESAKNIIAEQLLWQIEFKGEIGRFLWKYYEDDEDENTDDDGGAGSIVISITLLAALQCIAHLF